MEFWISQVFNGVSYGALLFLLAGGLSLIFGMMRIVNMTHGSYYLLGGYVALTVIWRTGQYTLGLLAGALAIALVGIGEWNAFLKRLSGQELGQVLTTMGFALIFQDLALVLWGGDPYTIPIPPILNGSYHVGDLYFPIYRIFIVAVAGVIGIILWLVLERTRLGAMIRATVDDPEMARGVGINVFRISMAVFALGATLAAVAGVVAGGFVGVYPGADFEILPYAFV
ncbi:MAG: branched-chain amino acid ABC transporter permease, partial [Candidatus Rokubacteria bacterium]|nr:branched-chain amino acid ABC transporter permease [Candidatus Rokubacteria bacterium]